MTLIRKRDRKDPTPEEIADLEKRAKEADKVWQEYLKTKDNKPDWMIDENSSHKEVLEYRAYTMPFKLQQMIDILEEQGNSLSDFAYNVYDDDPKERERWLKMAEDARQQAHDLRQKKWIYRQIADDAKKELRELF
jgi:hypothetical protein